MIYTLHLPPQEYSQMNAQKELLIEDEKAEAYFDGMIAVPEKKAQWALIFAPFWLAYHRLWWALGLYILYMLFAFGLLYTPYAAVVLFLNGLPGLYLLLEGHELRRRALTMQGYAFLGVAEGSNEQTAIERFLSYTPIQIKKPVRPVLPPHPSHHAGPLRGEHKGIGLFSESGA